MANVKKSGSLLCIRLENNISNLFECFSDVVLVFPVRRVYLEPAKELYSSRLQEICLWNPKGDSSTIRKGGIVTKIFGFYMKRNTGLKWVNLLIIFTKTLNPRGPPGSWIRLWLCLCHVWILKGVGKISQNISRLHGWFWTNFHLERPLTWPSDPSRTNNVKLWLR